MFDFLNNQLYVGDEIVFIAPNYRHLVKGIVIHFTPKNIKIKYINTWNFGSKGVEKTLLQDPKQVIKINTNAINS